MKLRDLFFKKPKKVGAPPPEPKKKVTVSRKPAVRKSKPKPKGLPSTKFRGHHARILQLHKQLRKRRVRNKMTRKSRQVNRKVK